MGLRKILCFAIVLLALGCAPAFAQTAATWTGTSGNWSNPLNWSTNPVVPNDGGGNFYNVTINGTGSDTVTFDESSALINSFTLGNVANAAFSGGTIQNNGVGQTLSVGDASSPTQGAFANAGTIDWSNSSTLAISGDVNNVGFMTLDSSELAIRGQYSVIGLGGVLTLEDGSNGTISGPIELESHGPSELNVNASNLNVMGDIRNVDGAIAIGNGSKLTVAGVLGSYGDNFEGDFSLTGGSSATVGSYQTGGIFVSTTIDDSRLTVASDFSVNGLAANAYIQNGAEVTINGNLIDSTTHDTYGPGGIYISGDSQVFVAGNALVTSVGYYTGLENLSITDSILIVGGTLTASGAGVSVGSGGALVTSAYIQNGASTTDISGTLTTNSYSQSGGSTIIETGGLLTANTFTATGGTVTVNGVLEPVVVDIDSGATLNGTGAIIGDVTLGGTIMPGASGTSPGTLTIIGNYEQTGAGTFEELLGPGSFSFLNVDGNVTLDPGAWLDLVLLNGFDPVGDSFQIMDYSSLTGEFANADDPVFLADGYAWDITYGPHDITLTARNAPEPSALVLLFLGVVACAAFARYKDRYRAETTRRPA